MWRITMLSGYRAATALLVTMIIVGQSELVRAAWPTGDLPICTSTGSQTHVNVIPDERGGVFVAWEDGRYSALYAQRVDAGGTTLWTSNGIMLPEGSASGIPDRFVVADGMGGLIYAWELNGDIYAEHVDSTGTADWNIDPVWGVAQRVPVCTAATPQRLVQFTSDGAGGIIATWEDHRNGSRPDIYAQRIDASGNPVWTTDGVPVCVDSANQSFPVIAADGSGGAFIAWQDQRIGTQVFVQHIDASGNALWAVDGILASFGPTSAADQWPGIISDEVGGAILGWTHLTPNHDLQMTRVLSDGSFVWNYTSISAAGVVSGVAEMVPTGDGGVIVVSESFCPTLCETDIFAFRLDSSGASVWPGGASVCAEPGDQLRPTAALDGSGILHVAWIDRRAGSYQIYWQRVDAAGSILDAVEGVPLSLNPRTALDEPVITSIAEGAVVAYTDRRNGTDDVFATMSAPVVTGVSGTTLTGTVLSPNWPNPFQSTTRFSFSTGEPRSVDLAVYDVAGRRVKTLSVGESSAGLHFVEWDGTGRNGDRVASGVYFVRMRSSAGVVSRPIMLLR